MRFTARMMTATPKLGVAQSVVGWIAVVVMDFEPLGRTAYGAPLAVAADDLGA